MWKNITIALTSKFSEMIIKGCKDCPLMQEGEEYGSCYCNHPDPRVNFLVGDKDDLTEGYCPEECPLRKNPLLITLDCQPAINGPAI